MNKATKIWLNYVVGAAISLVLLYSIYTQVAKQLAGIDAHAWQHTGNIYCLCACVLLLFVNTSLESYKWYLLAGSVAPLPYRRALASCLAGVAFSIITPNRVGEYPGRILYLAKERAQRYISVSVLGVVSQLSAVYIFGLAGLIYYNITFPSGIAKAALAACAIVNVLIALVYWRFSAWLPRLGRIRWLRRFVLAGRLLERITVRKQSIVLAISLLRFLIFTAQYLFLLWWMNVNVPLVQGLFIAALFFWVLAVIPSVSLTELGIRGSVCIYLFQHCSANTVGMLAATIGLWLLNLIVPSIIGSILITRMRILR